jgi:hypothetical protein
MEELNQELVCAHENEKKFISNFKPIIFHKIFSTSTYANNKSFTSPLTQTFHHQHQYFPLKFIIANF